MPVNYPGVVSELRPDEPVVIGGYDPDEKYPFDMEHSMIMLEGSDLFVHKLGTSPYVCVTDLETAAHVLYQTRYVASAMTVRIHGPENDNLEARVIDFDCSNGEEPVATTQQLV